VPGISLIDVIRSFIDNHILDLFIIKLECPKDGHVRKCSAIEGAMRLPFGRLYDVTVSLDTSVSN